MSELKRQPEAAPPTVTVAQIQMLGTLLAWVLYEKTLPNDAYKELLKIAVERHKERGHHEEDFMKCKNRHCVHVQQILLGCGSPRSVMGPMHRHIMDSYNLKIMTHPDGVTTVELRDGAQAAAVEAVPASALQSLAIDSAALKNNGMKLIVPGS